MSDDQANRTIRDLLGKADDLFDKGYAKAELNVLRGYKKALNDIKLELSDMFEKYNGNPTITELRKFKRLDALEAKITKIIGNMQRVEINQIQFGIKDSMISSFDRTGFAISTGTGLDIAFGEIPKDSMDYILRYNRWDNRVKDWNAKLLTDILTENEQMLRANASLEVAGGLAQGKSYAAVTKAIKNRFDVTAGRAKAIAYDQMHAGHMAGRVEGINQATDAAKRLGVETEKIWRHNPGAKVPRPDHVQMDGTPADENGIFTLPSGVQGEAPGLMNDVGENVFCGCSALFQVKGLDEL